MPERMSPAEPFRAAFGRLPAGSRANALLLALLAGALSAILVPRWLHDPELAHGLFMPVLFVVLLGEARQRGVQRYLPAAPALAAAAVLALGALACLGLAGLYAAALEWRSSLVEFLLAASVSGFLGAGLALFSRRAVRLVPCNWSSVLAVGLWILSAPFPPGAYARLTLRLQLWVSTEVMDALQLLGVAAHRQGNIIELAKGNVGIADACSGVRSLISCVYVALFFSATLVRRPFSRALVVLAAAPLALLMNFLRALLLTVMVDRGVEIEGARHDLTGFAILGLTALLLAALGQGLERGSPPPPPAPPAPADLPPWPAADRLLSGSLGLAALLTAAFVLATHPNPRPGRPAPDLDKLLPPPPASWRVVPGEDLARSATTLHTDRLIQATYLRGEGDALLQVTFSLVYWQPGQSSVSLVAEHTPDACWPAAGWQERARPSPLAGLALPGRELAPPESRIFAFGGFPEHVWFWHLYNGRPIPYQNPYSLRQLLSLAWHYGFRHDGDQLFVSVASNRPWAEIAEEPVVGDFFARLQPFGL